MLVGTEKRQVKSPSSAFFRVPRALWRIGIIIVFTLFTLHLSLAQDNTLPPQAPPDESVPSIPPPPGGNDIQSPKGQTPYHPSEPPTGYVPSNIPRVTVNGGVNVPVSGTNLKIDADFWRVDFIEGEAAVVVAKGHVKAVYCNYTVVSDIAQADLRTRVASFSGNVVLTANGQDVRGATLELNLDTKAWEFKSAVSQIKPELFPQIIRAPIYANGQDISGIDDDEIKIVNGGVTTCNLARPHYLINVGTSTIWPSHKLIARNASFYALGHRIFTIPRLAIPLREINDRQNLIPRVGMDSEEGFYVKAAYTLLANSYNTGNLKVDLMTKKGVGVGYEDNYRVGTTVGNFNIYNLEDQNTHLDTVTGRWIHNQQLGDIKATFTTDYRGNSYLYAPNTTSLATGLQLSRNEKCAQSSLSTQYSVDNNSTISSSILTTNFQHNQQFNEHNSLNLNLDYFRSVNPLQIDETTTVDAANSQLTTRFDYGYQTKKYDWNLRFSKINDLSSEAFIQQVGTQFVGMEQLPELAFSTSTERLGKCLPLGLPANFDISVGEYSEDLGRVETQRAVFGAEVPSHVFKLADQLKLTAGGGFRQYVYGDDTAQYAFDATADLTHQIGQKSSASLSYRFLQPNGFTPFRFDFIGKYNIINARLNIQETPKFKLSMYAGYDFQQPEFPWQDITTRFAYTPSENYMFYTSAAYNISQQKWRALINQVRLCLPNKIRVDVGSRYDIETATFASFKTQLDIPINDKWRIRANSGYNGFTKQFDYNDFQIVRDLHCMELYVTWVDQTGIWDERGIRVNLRIKAFPMFDNFNVGQFGQSLDTSVGEVL